MVLDHYNDATARWEAIALSILLPLTVHGRQQVCHGKLRIVDIADSREEIVARGAAPSSCFLFDTWIVKRIGMRKTKVLREHHESCAVCLLLLHLSVFWNGRRKATFLVEAANRTVGELCNRVRFENSRRTRDGKVLHDLTFPYGGRDARVRRQIELLVANVRALGNWSIEGFVR